MPLVPCGRGKKIHSWACGGAVQPHYSCGYFNTCRNTGGKKKAHNRHLTDPPPWKRNKINTLLDQQKKKSYKSKRVSFASSIDTSLSDGIEEMAGNVKNAVCESQGWCLTCQTLADKYYWQLSLHLYLSLAGMCLWAIMSAKPISDCKLAGIEGIYKPCLDLFTVKSSTCNYYLVILCNSMHRDFWDSLLDTFRMLLCVFTSNRKTIHCWTCRGIC